MTLTRESLVDLLVSASFHMPERTYEWIQALEKLSYERGLKDAYEQLDCVWSEPVTDTSLVASE